MLTNDLKWDLNTDTIIKKANSRMELLRRVAGFGATLDDLKIIYILFIRSLLQENYIGYKSALEKLDILTLKEKNYA